MVNPQSILELPMSSNDARAKTIKDYLIRLLLTVWDEGERFSGKRPFGNSGWEYDLYNALISAKIIESYTCGCPENKKEAHNLITDAILSLGK